MIPPNIVGPITKTALAPNGWYVCVSVLFKRPSFCLIGDTQNRRINETPSIWVISETWLGLFIRFLVEPKVTRLRELILGQMKLRCLKLNSGAGRLVRTDNRDTIQTTCVMLNAVIATIRKVKINT